MSIFINNVAVTTFDPMVKQAYQSQGFKLRNAVRMHQGAKQVHKFPKIGKGVAQQKALQDDVIPANLNYSQATVTMQDWHASDYSDIFGQAEVNFDEKRELAEALGKMIGRRSDQMIIDAINASGTTNTIAAGATGFTYIKFQEMIKLFTQNNIFTNTDPIHLFIEGTAQEDIMNDDKFINTRFTADRLFDNGNTLDGLSIGGVTFHVFGNMAEGGVPFSTPTFSAFAWAKNSVGMATSIDFRTEVNYVPQKTSFLVSSLYKANAVAIDAEGIVKIDYV